MHVNKLHAHPPLLRHYSSLYMQHKGPRDCGFKGSILGYTNRDSSQHGLSTDAVNVMSTGHNLIGSMVYLRQSGSDCIQSRRHSCTCIHKLVGCWGFTSLQHLRSYQDRCRLVTVSNDDDFTVLPHLGDQADSTMT